MEGALASHSAKELLAYIDINAGFNEMDDLITNYDTRGSKGFDDRAKGRGIDSDGYISLGVMPEETPKINFEERSVTNTPVIVKRLPTPKIENLTTTFREVPLELSKVPLNTFDTDFYKKLKPDNTLSKRMKLENSKFRPRTNRIQQQSLKDLNTSFNPVSEIELNDFIEIPKMSKLPIIILMLGLSSYYLYKKKQ